MRRAIAPLIGLLVTAPGCSSTTASTSTEPPPDPELVSVAEEVCPMLWRWQLTVGGAMNDMSHAAFREPDPEERRALYEEGIGRARQLIERLRSDVRDLTPGPYVDLLVTEVLDGLAVARQVLEGVEEEIEAAHGPDVPPPTYRDIVPGVFLDMEKVIDLAKPELAGYRDEQLIRAFVSVPECQHGVKDADDGVPRAARLG